MLDYFNELREGILEAYSGIVQGLKGEDQANNQLIISVSEDRDKTDSLTCCAVGLIGDIVTGYGSSVKNLVQFDSIADLLSQGRRSRISKTKSMAHWASKEMKKINAL